MAFLRTHYVSELSPQMDGKEVTLAGWVHEVRDIGKIKFLQIRDRTGIAQVVAKSGVVSEEVLKSMSLVKESVVLVKGTLKANTQAKIGFEIIPSEITDLNPISAMMPFEVTGKVPAELDVRLDNRAIDFRRRDTTAVFAIQSEILRAFREELVRLNFQEIRPPCITAAATEGGTDVFRLEYFDKHAFLVQSPQFYKQFAVIGGMDKVFMTIPVFRAEKHNTLTHLNEIFQMDVEMGFCDHTDAMDSLEKTVLNILSCVKKNCASSLEILGTTLDAPASIPRYTYTECVERLNKAGIKLAWGEDFSKEQERELFKLIPEELFFIVDWPTACRAFYSMPYEDNPKICKAFDLMYRGLEITSGAQRIHKYDMLVDAFKARNLEPEAFEFYTNAFKLGAPPHAGWSIGLERLTMKICGKENVREACLFPRDRMRLTP